MWFLFVYQILYLKLTSFVWSSSTQDRYLFDEIFIVFILGKEGKVILFYWKLHLLLCVLKTYFKSWLYEIILFQICDFQTTILEMNSYRYLIKFNLIINLI